MSLSANGIENNLIYQSVFVNDSWRGYRYSPAPATLDQCKCSVAFDCLEERGLIWCIYGNNCTVGTTAWVTPGLFKSCTDLGNVFDSDFRCFFNQTCVDKLLSLYNYDMPTRLPLPAATMDIRAMDSSVTSRFAPTDTVNKLFDDFLIEEWEIEADFDRYYGACAPSQCVYTYSQRMDMLYLVTSIFSLLGGLTIIFRLLIPIGVRLVEWMISYCSNQQQRANGSATNGRRGIVSAFFAEDQSMLETR